ncbi:MAG TPA: alpha/beta hydrolase family protein [Kofleriaceae bacterium]|nr:alpha/beta hydrolase family protein [Kofleriaceae bacterium]
MSRAFLLWIFVAACGGGQHAAAPEPPDAEAPQLWMQVAGDGDPTVVFEAGDGDDSSVWASVEPDVRLHVGVRTVVYDRAGLGKSAPAPGSYRIEDEAAALLRALDRFGVRGPIVLVAHSYGGFIARLVAAGDPRVVGMVLVDANLPEFFDDAELAYLQAKHTAQISELERKNPALARVMGPLMRAYPATVARVRAATLPANLPIVDIVAERSWGDTEQENAAMRRVHAAFVAASPAREAVLATGSGHHVMRDRPEVVVNAIGQILRRVRAS